MESATDRLSATGDRIAAARRTIADTEEVAISISDELSRNREKIQASHEKVRSVNSMSRAGGKIIGRMAARDRRQRMLMYTVMAFIVVAILLVLYYGLVVPTSTDSTPPPPPTENPGE